MIRGPRPARAFALALIILPTLLVSTHARATGSEPAMQEPHRPPVEVTVEAKRYSFSPNRIEVEQDDIVKITLKAQDVPHSFAIDQYRIAKRAAPGQPVTFEFRADRPGTFPYYCNLTSDERCKEMRGELVVRAKR